MKSNRFGMKDDPFHWRSRIPLRNEKKEKHFIDIQWLLALVGIRLLMCLAIFHIFFAFIEASKRANLVTWRDSRISRAECALLRGLDAANMVPHIESIITSELLYCVTEIGRNFSNRFSARVCFPILSSVRVVEEQSAPLSKQFVVHSEIDFPVSSDWIGVSCPRKHHPPSVHK